MPNKILHLLVIGILIIQTYSSTYGQSKRSSKHLPTSSPCKLILKDAPKIHGLHLGMTVDEFRRILPNTVLSSDNPNIEFGSETYGVSTEGNSEFEGLSITKVEFFEGKLSVLDISYNDYEPTSIGDFVSQAAAKLNLPAAGWVGWTSRDTKTRSLGCNDFMIRIGMGSYSEKARHPPFLSMIDINASEILIKRMVSSLKDKIMQKSEADKKRRVFKP